ncbi:MAG: 1-aminocyclopropane-1-carboxylate synthase [Bacteroides eggerthii]|nr:1-aminocyclopropane-1-carboxylate synthase [Bacteroides eggerthii]
MTKTELNQMCREYQAVLSMSETEVLAVYEESKAECVASFEAEIDYWEKIMYNY